MDAQREIPKPTRARGAVTSIPFKIQNPQTSSSHYVSGVSKPPSGSSCASEAHAKKLQRRSLPHPKNHRPVLPTYNLVRVEDLQPLADAMLDAEIKRATDVAAS